MTRRTASLLLLTLLVACGSAEERSANARQAAREALGRGERPAALAALARIEPESEAPEALLEHADLLVAAAEAPQAVWLLESGLRRHAGNTELGLTLARLQLAVDNPTAALAAAQAIAPGSPQHPAALLVAAQAELQLGSLERSLELLEEAERLYPDRLEARLVRVSVLVGERRLAEARALLDEMKQAHASDALPKETRATLRRLDVTLYVTQAEEDPDEATLAGLRKLVAEDPDDALAREGLAQVLMRAGRPLEAVEGIEAAIAEDPERIALYPLAASLRAALGESETAEGWLRKLVERSPTPTAYVYLASYRATQRNTAGVLAAYAEGVAALPEDPTLARLHAEALVDADRLADADDEVERFRGLAPADPNVDYLRARLELASGNAPGAAERLERLVSQLDQPYTQYWLGKALEAQGDRKGAARRYGLAIQRNPTEPSLYGPLLELSVARGDWREVAATATELVRRAPGIPEGWSALCGALVNLGRGEEAEQTARRFARIFPDRPDAALFVARALRVRGQHAAALEELAALEARSGTSAETQAERALTLALSGRTEEGIAAARAALGKSPDSALLHRTLATILFGAGQAEEGAQEVDRALALEPEEPEPLRLRAEYFAATGRFEEARADAERYLAARPDAAGVHFVLGYANEKAGRRDAAIAAYRRTAELDPLAFAPRNNLALLLAETDIEGALAAAQEAYALAPENPSVLDTLGWLYFQAGRVDRSISLLEDARRAAPADPETGLHLALAYREAGRPEDARRLLVALRGPSDGPGGVQSRIEEALRSLP